nr:hypothetical protein [uncultured Pseudomonas sp.]
MKLEIARGLFLMASLGVASIAVAAWYEPEPGVVDASNGANNCPRPPRAHVAGQEQLHPDQDLLLFMYSLSQGMRASG